MFACLHVVYRRQSSLPYYMIQSSYYIQRSQISSSFVDTELRVFLPYFVHSSREVSTEHGATKQASKLRDDWNRRPRRKGGKRHSHTPPRRRLSAFDSRKRKDRVFIESLGMHVQKARSRSSAVVTSASSSLFKAVANLSLGRIYIWRIRGLS
jgi:hypothetical protein